MPTDIITFTAADYYFRSSGNIDGDDPPARMTTDHFMSNGYAITVASDPHIVDMVPMIEVNATWGTSVDTDDDTGYATADSAGFSADVNAAYGLTTDWYLLVLGTIVEPWTPPAGATDIFGKAVIRARVTDGGTEIAFPVIFGDTTSGVDFQEVSESGLTSSFQRFESTFFGLDSGRLAALAAGECEMQAGELSFTTAGVLDVAYMALEIDYTLPDTPTTTGGVQPRRIFQRSL